MNDAKIVKVVNRLCVRLIAVSRAYLFATGNRRQMQKSRTKDERSIDQRGLQVVIYKALAGE
ncbi:MAG: hypothetical protein ACJAY7_001292 [Pseudohongiellaceae bacterium]|jgi:hypothetical protein